MEDQVRIFILTQANITALIGDRIWAGRLPERPAYPAITYWLISKPRVRSHSGNSNLSVPRIQYSCWGSSYASAKALVKEVVNSMEGYRGPMGSITCYASFVENEVDLYDEEVQAYYIPVDIRIWNNG